MINNKFVAVYNVFNKKLAVKYGNSITRYDFEREDEWCKISFNGDNYHPNYLHVHLGYDQGFHLIFYSRIDGSQSLHKSHTIGFYSQDMHKVPDCIKLAYNDSDFSSFID